MPEISPTYLTVDANGNVGAEFTGEIEARGIELEASGGSSDRYREVRWVRQSDGARVAFIEATDTGTGRNFVSRVNKDSYAFADSITRAQKDEFGNPPSAELFLRSDERTNASSVVRATVVNPSGTSHRAKIIDGDGNSDFANRADRQLDSQRYGALTSVGPGGIFASGTWSVPSHSRRSRFGIVWAGASVHPGSAGNFAGISLYIDGVEHTSSVNFYDVYTHMWQTLLWMGEVGTGNHTWELRTNNNGRTDGNDRYSIGIMTV